MYVCMIRTSYLPQTFPKLYCPLTHTLNEGPTVASTKHRSRHKSVHVRSGSAHYVLLTHNSAGSAN